MSDRLQNYIGAALANLGICLPGDIHVLVKSRTSSAGRIWSESIPRDRCHTSIITAETIIDKDDGKNDVLLLTPEAHSLAAGLDWSCNMSHIVGGYDGGGFNNRCRIGMSTTFTPMITVSGYGNIIANVYSQHGTAVGDYVGWLISGIRNRFHRVHFGGPMNAAQGGDGSYIGVHITGTENYFYESHFGTNTIGRDEASPNVQLGAGTLTIFDHCHFHANLTDGDPLFLKVLNTSGYTMAWFIDCTFDAFSSNYAVAMTKAIECTGGHSCRLIFTPGCVFDNVTALSDATDDSFVSIPRTFSTTTDTEALINVLLAV
jgi:hypothetical protein